MNDLPRPSEFDSLQPFIQAVFARLRTMGKRKHSYQWLARRLGYRSQRTVGMVFEGKRLPSRKMLEKVAGECKLSPHEQSYLNLLLEKAIRELKQESVVEINERLDRMSPKLDEKLAISNEMFSFLSDWYFLPILVLVEGKDFKEEIGWIQKRLRNKVSAVEIRRALRVMSQIGLIQKTSEGRWITTNKNIRTEPDLLSKAVQEHAKQMMIRAKEALSEQLVTKREFISVTMRMDSTRIAEAKEALRQFRTYFETTFESANGNGVFQLNLHFFQHTDF